SRRRLPLDRQAWCHFRAPTIDARAGRGSGPDRRQEAGRGCLWQMGHSKKLSNCQPPQAEMQRSPVARGRREKPNAESPGSRIMSHNYWLLLGSLGLAAALTVGCSSEFRTCMTTRACPVGGGGG